MDDSARLVMTDGPAAAAPRGAAAARDGRRRVGIRAAWALLALLVALPVWAEQPRGEDESGGFRYRPQTRAAVVEATPGGSPEQALRIYNEFKGQSGGISKQNVRELMTKMYPAAGDDQKALKTVALLISKGLDEASTSAEFREKGYKALRIDEATNKLMALEREAMIEEVVLDVARKNKWEIARSNSGNIESGMRSDLDQTFYVFRLDENGRLIRDPNLDTDFLKQFRAGWDAKYGGSGKGLKLQMLDVVSIEGKANYPDPRAHPSHVYGDLCHGTIATLRNIEGAYTTYGAQLQQVTRRAWQAMESGSELAWQQFGPAKRGEPGGEYRKNPTPDMDLARRTICFGPPELVQAHAFNAAVSNYLELLHYMTAPKFETKYHLRTFDDAMFTKFCLETQQGIRGKQDYLDMSSNNRQLYADMVLKQLFGNRPDAAEKIALHADALEVSRAYRLLHKTKDPKVLLQEVEAFARHGSVPADVEAQRRLILEPLVKKLYPTGYDPNVVHGTAAERITLAQLEAAEACYRRLASEFCLESIYHTSTDAYKVMQSPQLADRCRPLLGIAEAEWDNVRLNIAESAHISLLYSMYDLGWRNSWELRRRLAMEAPDKGLDLFVLWAKGRVAPAYAFKANPQAYLDRWSDHLYDLKEMARLQMLAELGFEKAVEADTAHRILDNEGLVWNWRKLGKRMFGPDLGTLESLTQVVRAYVVSQGDPEVVLTTVGQEVFLSIPVIGQVAGAARGGPQGFLLLGAAIKWPLFGKIMIVYSIGQACYAIYEVEYALPAQNNLANAIYRGFAGPETKDYGAPGRSAPVWNDNDQKELDALQRRLRDAQPFERLALHMTTGSAADSPSPETMDRWEAEYQRLQAQAAPRIEELLARRQAFMEYRDSDFAGRSATVTEQKWVDRSLLDAVQPRYGFFTGGVVDFGATWDPARSPAEIERLQRQAEATATLEERAALETQLFEMRIQKDRWGRAQRYKDAALGTAERPQANKELAYRIRRDSLYAHFENSAQTPEQFVDEWFKKHEEAVAKQLVAHGLLGSAQWHYRSWTADVPVESIPPESRDWWQQNYPATIFRKDVKDEVRQRFLADVERSKQLTLAYRDLEKGRLEKQRENITEGIRRIKNEAFGLAVPAMAKEPQYMDFLRALPYSAIRRQAPKVEATFYKTAVSHKDAQGKAGEPLREALHISVGCDIVADTTLYLPFSDKEPYKVESAVLKADEALPDDLMPEARAEIQKLKSEHAQPLRDGNGLIAVASVYCAGVADLAGALKATYEGLPAMDKQGQRGKILFAQQVAFIPVETLKVRVDPVRVLVTDQAGAPLGDIPDLVKIAGQPAKPSKEEYWGVHEFTTYQEKIPIEAAYTMPDGTVVEGRAEFSVDDVENWQDPQPPKEPITIRLPIYKAGTLKVAGRVNAQPPPDAPYPESAVVFNKALEVSTGVHLPGGDNGARNVKEWLVGMVGDAIAGAFDQVAERPQDGTFEATLRAPIRAGTPIKLTALGATFRDDFQGEVTVDPPAGPGTINVGTITLRAITQTVTVPGWDRPIPAKDYLAKLGEVGLRGKPQLGDPAPEATRAFTVQEASPAPGTQVRRGTEVVVTAHGDYAREVPDVRDQPAQAAVRMMTDAGFKTTQELGPAAESENRQYTVASQSVAPGTKHRPDQPVHLVLRGPFVAGRKMPRLVGLTQDQAREALETAGIKAVLEVVDRQQPPDDPAKADTIYKQEPAEKADVGTQETVRLWLFAGRGAPPGRPYYAAFRLVWPKLKEGIQSPKRGEGESQQAYKERKRRFYEGLNESNFDWVPQPDDKNLLIFHVSNEALAMYPREGFVSGQPYAIGIDGQTKDKDGQTQSFRGALLLTSAGTVETMEQLLETFPALRAKEKLEAMAFTKRDGTMARSDEKGTWLLGPIRAGWSSQDRQLAMRLMVAILSAFDCFIATTVYDSPVAEPVEVLRGFRDEVLLASPAGRRLVEWYYLYGPRMATAVMKEPRLARPTRAALDVLVWVLKHTDTRSGRVRWLIDLGLAPIEQVLRAVLPPADSMMDEFGRDLIRTRFLDGPATDPPEPTAAPPAPKEGEPE